ncbi:MAG: sulfatase-like hydrolase/transferase [Planctomycetota bacterium]
MSASPHPRFHSAVCLLLASALALLVSAAASPAAEPARPNFLVIVADDLGWGDVGWHGGPYKTPNLDRLCREGVELDQHYVSPMCSPTRAALLSGRYASRFGCTAAQAERVFPFGTVTLASALGEVGYETAITGKWHLGSLPEWGPQRFGFDHGYGSLGGGCGPYDHRYKVGPFTETWHRNGTRITEEGHVTDLITREATRWLSARGEKPFLLYVPFTAVHIPIKEPQRWLDLYPEIAETDRKQYAACVSHLDDAVGEILAALDRSGKREQTMIVFFSDNGGTQARNDDPKYPPDDYPAGRAHGSNLPLRGNKGQLYEGGIRVPAFVNWQGQLSPGKFTAPMHAADWLPTLGALAGYQPSQSLRLDGCNLWPWISGAEKPAPRALYWAGTRFQTAAVRDGDWKLFVDREKDKVELFNLADDPHEQSNLADKETARVEQLRNLLAEIDKADNDSLAKEEASGKGTRKKAAPPD